MARALSLAVLLLPLVACGPPRPVATPARPMAVEGTADEGGSPKEAAGRTISVVRFRDSASSPWEMSPVLPELTSSVFCTFELDEVPEGRRVSVVWRRGGRELARTVRVTGPLTRTMGSEMASDAPLGSGTYDVEILVGDRVAARTSFRIAGEDRAVPEEVASEGPRIAGLTLSSGECVPDFSGGSRAPAHFNLALRRINVCLEFEDMRPGQVLEVRWYRSSASSRPLAVTSYSPEGGGELSGSYVDDGLLRPGPHHVAIFLDDREIGRATFIMEE